jgi:hypothetical protein
MVQILMRCLTRNVEGKTPLLVQILHNLYENCSITVISYMNYEGIQL